MTALADIERLLKDTIGLDADAIGSSAIERAVRERQNAGRFADSSAYLEAVTESEAERQALVEAIVVPETWFLRDRGGFDGLAKLIEHDSRRAATAGVLRVLSVPCSSGEEPYSIAITLQEAGLHPSQYRIDAADVSHHALAKARRALFAENSFRGTDETFRERYFSRVGSQFQLTESIRSQISFHQGNLLAPGFMAGVEPYDVVFCRNLFIYFDRATQQRAITALSRLMTPDGVLFVASSETGVFLDGDFVSANLSKAFAFRRRGGGDRVPEHRSSARVAIPVLPVPVATAAPARQRPTPAMPKAAAPPVLKANAAASPAPNIEHAYQLADQGHFVEAATLCTDHLRREGPSARAFYLLGLVRDATGNESDAESFYRKALYLDPGHREALVHLALLMDRRGNAAGAEVLRSRMRRLETAGTTK